MMAMSEVAVGELKAGNMSRVLVADDDPVSCKLLSAMLTKWEYAPTFVHDGLAALRELRKQDAPRLAILDWMMPGLDGIQVIKNLRATYLNSYTYVLLLTSKDGKEDFLEALDAGADDYLSKPFDARELHARLQVGGRILEMQSRLVTALETAKTREASLRESEEKLSTAFHLIPDAVYITDFETGHYIELNEGFELYTGYCREEALGKNSFDLNLWANPKEREEFVERFRRARRVRNYLGRFRHRDGREFWGELSADLIEIKGRQCALYTTRDVSERLHAEEERRRLEAQVHQAQKLESLGSLAGGVAHDMNNVLGAILGLATTQMERASQAGPLRDALETIAKACLRGRTMVQSLLDFSRPHLARESLLDLNATVRDEIELLERTTLRRIQFETELEGELRPVMGDPGALSHILMNLCLNAVDAMPEGGKLTIQTCNWGDNQVQLTVTDSGCGMAPNVLQKALDPFFTTKPQGKGTGLGLSIVYATVKAHRGQMEIQSGSGTGTRVLITLPAQTPKAPEQESRAIPVAAQGCDLRVLVVDDDDMIKAALQDQLEYLGHSVATASSGEEALQRLEQGLEADVVILDLNMPGLGGAQTLPRLRSLCPSVPVLLATGRADQRARDLAQQFSRVSVLPKPFSLRELRAQLIRITSGVNPSVLQT